MEPRKRAAKIEVIRPDEIISIESKITVTEIAKQQLKQIEKSKAWQDHVKTHKDARLFALGAAESSKELNGVEKALFEATEQKAKRQSGPAFEEQKAPGQEVQVKMAASYKSGPSENQQFAYHGGHVTMASCDCGQKFKIDEEGNASQYKINTESSAVTSDFGAYKKSSPDTGFSGYKKANHDEKNPRIYGR